MPEGKVNQVEGTEWIGEEAEGVTEKGNTFVQQPLTQSVRQSSSYHGKNLINLKQKYMNATAGTRTCIRYLQLVQIAHRIMRQ